MHLFAPCLASLLLVAPLAAQEKPAAPATEKILSVTVILRHAGQNIPAKFTSFMTSSGDGPTIPLLAPETDGWIAAIQTYAMANKAPGFSIEILDTNRLVFSGTEQDPTRQIPVRVLEVSLPYQLDAEIQVYKSRELSIAVLVESWSE